MNKIISQDGGFLNYFRPLITAGLSLIKNVLSPLPKSVLISLELTAAVSGTNATIRKEIFGSCTTTLIISNKDMEHNTKIVKSLKELGFLIKSISETIKMKPKNQKADFAKHQLLVYQENVLAGQEAIRVDEGTIKADQNFSCHLIL